MKTCRTCYRSKPPESFPEAIGFKDGYDSRCKSCRALLLSAKRVGGLSAYITALNRRITSYQVQANVKIKSIEVLMKRRKEVEYLKDMDQVRLP